MPEQLQCGRQRLLEFEFSHFQAAGYAGNADPRCLESNGDQKPCGYQGDELPTDHWCCDGNLDFECGKKTPQDVICQKWLDAGYMTEAPRAALTLAQAEVLSLPKALARILA